ncbi:antibiotic biosynthesis monooxygenase [Geomonas terrae]|uniref:Antibiotic biosynthesis monooxygenase n=1 Tax=Geomonas terrae TaxID=2562681 RepID=A0A4V3P0B2_9BACT|nr:putative quinol monooxygenase [Geomonas terrae]TGU74922.1 antibiotic biosynthesis monooxygenase [Geomonas terrae]
MICVLASIRVKEGAREAFLKIFNENVPKVKGEAGCIEYFPALDIDAALPVQVRDERVVTIIEKWQSVEALHAHLASPHMLDYKERVQDLVEDVTLKVLQPV